MMWTKHLLASVVLFSCGFCFEFVEKNERILLGSNNRPILTSFSRCKKSSVTEGKLICTCGNNNKLLRLTEDSSAQRELSYFGNHIRHLEIVLCSLRVQSGFFGFLRLNSLHITGSRVLRPDEGAFSNFSTNTVVKIANVGNPLSLVPHTFDETVSKVTFENVKFFEFSTDSFAGLPDSAELEIVDSSVTVKYYRTLSGRLKIRSFTVLDSLIHNPGHTFMELEASEIHVLSSSLNLFVSNAMNAVGTNVSFKNSTLRVSGDSLAITAKQLQFINVTFLEPKQRALASLRPQDPDSSTLTLSGVTLVDPSRGALLNGGFQKVAIENLTVDEICLCQIVDYLLSDLDDLGVRVGDLGEAEARSSMERLRESAENSTFCRPYPGADVRRPGEVCAMDQSGAGVDNATAGVDSATAGVGSTTAGIDSATAGVLALLIVGVITVFLSVGIFVYKWHKVIQMKYKILRQMKVVGAPGDNAQDGIKTYKQTLVSFDLQNVQVIPRQPSVFLIDSQPDVVRSSLQKVKRPQSIFQRFRASLAPSIEEDEERTENVKALDEIERSTRAMIRNIQEEEEKEKSQVFESVDLEDTGSVIIRDDADV